MSYQMSLFDIINNRQEFKIDKPIRLIELFAGYGSQHFALEYLGANFESYKICEWAIKSIQAYKDAHFSEDNTDYSKELTKEQVEDYLFNKGISSDYNEPLTITQIKRLGEDKTRNIYNNIIATHNLVSVVNCKAEDLEIVDRDKYTYMLTYSFPCVTDNTLVLSEKGYIPFRQLKIGDKVLTKSNTWQKVVKQFDNGVTDIYNLKAFGTAGIECTKEHKFFAREMYRKGHKSIRCFKDPIMVHAKDLTKNHYLGIPVILNEIPFYTDDINFWYMIGMYLGDGWLNTSTKDIRFGFNDKKIEKFSKLGFKYSVYDNNNSCKCLRLANKDFYNFIEQYIGTGCNVKHIPIEILNLPKKQLQALYDGYLATDGCVINNKHQFTSVNESMSYSLLSIIHKLYNRPASIYKIKTKPTKLIQGRNVNQQNWYQIRFKLNTSKYDKAFYENNYIWFPFKSLTYIRKDNVYNMEIENDHSYIINGVVSANCQDLSKAGYGKGMTKGSGTRSGLLWEVERILDECNGNLPQVLVMENVPDVIGEKNKLDFAKWYQKLESLGYANFYQILNAKDYGIPQNRERCFMVSILGDYFYNFPTKFKLEKRLKDLLEPYVDEKYYLSEKMIRFFKENAINNELKGNGFRFKPVDFDKANVSKTITTRAGGRMDDNFIIMPEATKKGYAEAQDGDGVYINRPHQKRGVVQKGMIQTIKTSPDIGVVVKDIPLKRGYSVEVKEESPDTTEIDIIGNYSKSDYNATPIVGKNGVAPTVRENHGQVTAVTDKSLFTETQAKMFTEDGNVKRYIDSDIVDEFKEGQCADISFPNGYNKGPRVHDECPAINTTTTASGFVVKTQSSLDTSNQKVIPDEVGTLKDGMEHQHYNNLRIRKLTPKECFRLMGVKDEDFEKIAKNQSNASLYHLAGDSIVITVLMSIFAEMLNVDYKTKIEEILKNFKSTR